MTEPTKDSISDAIQRFAIDLMRANAEPPQSIVFDSETFRRFLLEILSNEGRAYARPPPGPEDGSVIVATPAGEIIVRGPA